MSAHTIFLSALLYSFVTLFALPSAAQDNFDSDALLQAAKDDLQARLAAHDNDTRFALRERIDLSGDDHLSIEYVFDPAKPVGEQWNLLHPSEAEDAEARKEIIKDHLKQQKRAAKKGGDQGFEPDQDAVVRKLSETVGDAPQFVRVDGDAAIYSFQPKGDGLFGSHDKEGDKGKKRKKSAKATKSTDYLRGEFAISKVGKHFAWIHIYTIKSFKPVAVAKVKTFDLTTQFAPAWDGGPLVITRQEVKAAGSAMFKKFNQHSLSVKSDFQKR